MRIARNILAFFVGAIAGGIVNMGIIMVGSKLIPAPAGVDVSNAESIANSIHLFEPKHFITPFLAHAIGTLAGVLIAYLIAASYKPILAYLVGVLSLIGGIAACFMIPAPAWFMALDLIVAYIPMAWLAILLGKRIVK